MNIEERIKIAKTKTREAHNEQIKLRAQLQQLNQQRQEIIAECKSKGFNPETLAEDQQKYETQLETIVQQLEELLQSPKELPF